MLTTVEILTETARLLKNGRARFGSHIMQDEKEYYCPLGAIAKARGFHPIADEEFVNRVYDNTIAAKFIAQAIEKLHPTNLYVDTMDDYPEEYRYTTVVHCWNDETVDDEKVFEVVDAALDHAIQVERRLVRVA